jgi:hypothetical protein
MGYLLAAIVAFPVYFFFKDRARRKHQSESPEPPQSPNRQ